MAAAADKSKKSADAKDPKEAPEGGKSKKKLLIIVIAAVLVLGGGGAGAWFFLKKPDAAHGKPAAKTAELPKPAQYFAMDPAFVVNLNGSPDDGPHYLQMEVQLMTRDPEELKLITENAPAIRAHLLMLFSQVQAKDIADIAGRKKLQAAALADAQKLMAAETGKKCVEELLFTSFVTQ
ncbi:MULTISPECIES: flagellar basal body-associated FliL family protein [Xanthomonas translucens group]|uniref:Flagellar protein FliL n=1 Tax=Xanthomonas cerealis pv. cerealis TaxID=152263 RepID=A0A514EC73_9XANT|nr:flagellar basal body-associated FliL family protein [Xanthomonas translucens]QDI03555.1 flagellar basal body protein FliL [Xanthomonas translucens pv. cerealis]UKE48809.1 flagellar basal body-associated FliL family protein [Xanthomonas translucens pv. cerealis]UKE67945.1 flagellar basal body-associated FliL family protein [Xanthomonas translucens pv. pistacia]